jgi:hypothetical protein
MTKTTAALLTLLLLVLLAPAWATHGVDTDDDGIIDLPFDPLTLEAPDRDDVRDAFVWERITWNQNWLIASKCGGFERIEACEDRGGYVVVEDGLGCGSTVKLYQYAGFGKSKKVLKMAGAGRLAGVNAAGELVQVPRETETTEVLAKAVQGKLVMISAVARDRRRLKDVAEVPFGCRCTCVVDKLVGAQVVNAEKGDVGLVPLSAPGGEDIVVTIFNAIEQRHRHAVIFLGPHRIRHNTAYDEPDQDDMLDNNEFKLGPLNNATPGVTTESVASAIANGRLAYEGLLLKPAADWIRPLFEVAADEASGVEGYYKISDYSGLDGMALPYGTAGTANWEDNELRGTMCSGLVHWAFTQAGFVVSETFYPASLRDDVADVLYDTVKDEIGANLGFFEEIGSFLFTGTQKKLANQIVNCFAGLGCDDNSDTWKRGVGSAWSVSPDNLLPQQFTLQGSGCAPWGDREICAGDVVVNPDGASVTPFLRVEPMQYLGSHWEQQVLEDW